MSELNLEYGRSLSTSDITTVREVYSSTLFVCNNTSKDIVIFDRTEGYEVVNDLTEILDIINQFLQKYKSNSRYKKVRTIRKKLLKDKICIYEQYKHT